MQNKTYWRSNRHES